MYVAMMTFIVLAALAQLGIQTTSFIAVIAPRSWPSVSPAGSRPISPPDSHVDLQALPGQGLHRGAGPRDRSKNQIFTTQLATVDNKVIIIPNAKMIGDNIVNYSSKPTRRWISISGRATGMTSIRSGRRFRRWSQGVPDIRIPQPQSWSRSLRKAASISS